MTEYESIVTGLVEHSVVHAVCYELPLIWKLFIGLRKQTNFSLNPSNVPNNITATRCIKI